MTRVRLAPALIVVLSLTLAGCPREESRSAPDDRPVPVDVVAPFEGPLPRARHFTASTMPMEMVVLSFKTTGRLKEVLFEEGDRVTRGQPLARLDPVDQYMARQVAREQLRSLAPDVERLTRLAGQGAVAEAEKERVLGWRDALATQLGQADIALGATHLAAPRDGIIGRRMAHPGEMMEPSRPLGVLLAMDPLKVVLAVRAEELAWFPAGHEVRVALAGRTLTGRVHQVASAADEVTRLFQVTLTVPNPPDAPELRAGQLARVEIDLPPLAGRFVPEEVVELGAGGLARLPGIVDGRVKLVVVKPGAREGGWVAIEGELPKGLQVVLGFELPEGQPVTVRTAWTRDTWASRPKD